jgi:DNA polymerase-3 subunit delta'
MNLNAANALLKTLEEPAQGAILLLVTDQISHLPATIKSRCQRISFPRPDQHEALSWLRSQSTDATLSLEQALRLAHGAPLLALATLKDEELPIRNDMFTSLHQLVEMRADPLALAAKWQKIDPVKWLELVLGWVSDIIRLQLGGNITQLLNQDYEQALNASVARIPLQKNIQLLENLLAVRAKMSVGVNFNKQLLMESLLIRWMEPSA